MRDYRHCIETLCFYFTGFRFYVYPVGDYWYAVGISGESDHGRPPIRCDISFESFHDDVILSVTFNCTGSFVYGSRQWPEEKPSQFANRLMKRMFFAHWGVCA